MDTVTGFDPISMVYVFGYLLTTVYGPSYGAFSGLRMVSSRKKT